MSLQDGWAALNLEMPKRVPRTEYSVDQHWELVKVVTGRDVSVHSPDAEKRQASEAFAKAWNFDYIWSVMVSDNYMHGRKTDMGHAVYAAGGVDRREAQASPFVTPDDVFDFDPMEEYGRLPNLEAEFTKAYENNCRRFPDAVNSSGVYITMFSGFIAAFGWEMLLLAAGSDPKRFGEVAQRYEAWIQQFFEAFANTDIPVMMCHDDLCWTSGPVLNPAWYREYVFPAYKRLWRPVLESGKKILFTSDGDYTMFIDDIAACGAHGFALEPCTDMQYIADNFGQTHAFIGNADTRVLLAGSRDEIRQEVERCMAIGKHCPGFFMAVGNHIPANTPVENALFYNEVYEELSQR